MQHPAIHCNKTHRQQGFSLIELMIGLVLGLFVIGVIITVFVQTKRNFNQDELIAQMQENGRYALQLLSREVAHAGFLGGMSAIDSVTTSETFSDTCADWFNPLAKPIEVYSASDANSKTCFSSELVPVKSGTQVLVIKRTAGKQTAVADILNNKLYFSTPGQGGTIFKSTTSGSVPSTYTGQQQWEYFVEIYYIQDEDSDGDGTSFPGLFRKRLVVTSGNISVTDDGLLVPGTRMFGVLYGIDGSLDDGIADQYYEATSYSGDLSKLVSARVSVLAMSTDEDHNYANNKQYSLYPNAVAVAYVAGLSNATTDPTDANAIHYYGRIFSTSTQVRNNAYRIQIYSLNK